MAQNRFARVLLLMVAGLRAIPSNSLLPAPQSLTLTLRLSSLVQRGAPKYNVHPVTSCCHPGRKKQCGMLLALPSFPTSIIQSSPSLAQNPMLSIAIYAIVTNLTYLLRRSHIRNMPKRKLLRIRLTREEGVTLRLHATNIIVWQLFVTTIFPLLEPISRIFGYVSFYYFYPNAKGLGVIFEPLSVQSYPMAKRAKSQIRCDWHKFSVNVGAVGRDGYRHPPSVERNLPHLDIPQWGWKHWPWRRRIKAEQDTKVA